MRIALFGGSFDPPHRGHLAIARAAADRLRLDRVLVAPVGSQPLKRESPPASFADRMEMVRLAVARDPRLEASAIDAPRADGKPNYTLDTLRTLRAESDADDEIFCLIGADSYLSLARWHGASELLFAADFIVASRPGFALDTIPAALPQGVHLERLPLVENDGYVRFPLAGGAGERGNLLVLPDLHIDISATEIRAAFAGGEGEDSVLPSAVVAYIRRRGLYS